MNFPYNVNFHYNATTPTNIPLNINIGKIIFYGLIGYLILKLRGRFKNMGGGTEGITEMLSGKKFEPIKP